MDALDILCDYLRDRFPHFDLQRRSVPAGDVVTLSGGGRTYEVRLDGEVETGDLRAHLDEWNVAAELERVEGMRVVVTRNGIRLDSAN